MLVAMISAMLAAAFSPAASAPNRASDTATLRALDRALLDAVGVGDRGVWSRAMTRDSVYVDENGVIIPRDSFLKQLEPLPHNVSGSIHITAYRVSFHGNVALVIHTDDEREIYHGQRFHTDYLTTETWYRESGAWKLALTHVYAVNETPRAISLPPKKLAQYAGCYSAASDLHYRIAITGAGLSGSVVGRPAHPLFAEVADVFFVTGQPRIRMIFQRDRAGRVTGYLSRREGGDLVWKRVKDGACAPTVAKRL